MPNDRVSKVIADTFGVNVNSIADATEPNDIEHWDSLGHMNLMGELEKEFGVTFEIDEIMEASSVGAIVNILESKGVDDG